MRQGTIRGNDAFDQDFDLAAALFAAIQARLDHAGVVEYEQVAGLQKLGQICEHAIVQAAPGIQMEQAAVRPMGGGRLGNKFRRQFVVELGKFKVRIHGSRARARNAARHGRSEIPASVPRPWNEPLPWGAVPGGASLVILMFF